MPMIAVVDYGMGNLRSVLNALQFVAPDQEVILTSDASQIRQADRVVFPGQGAAGDCIRAIDEYALRAAIIEATQQQPFLGICMGMQVLLDHSEENGGIDCLGLIAGQVRYFGDLHKDQDGSKLKVPHMGWNQVWQSQQHPLWHAIADGSRFYFVHSYYSQFDDSSLVAGRCDYGFSFASVMAQNNVFALQCHPEKSAEAGLQLLRNFVQWDGRR